MIENLENQSAIGKLLGGHYKIVATLGSGGFSQTYVAEDTHRPGNPKCAVKHLQPINSNQNFLQSARRLFNSEADTLEKLGHHDRIPRLLAYFEENQEFYLVQEFIEGKLLTDKLPPRQPWTENQVWEFIKEILEILVFIHAQGFIHRDIKPSNIIQRLQDNKLVLVDFGAVKQNWTQLLSLTSNIEMPATIGIGTPGYMPVEQARGRPRPSSDIYALGAIAVQALTGLYPTQLEEEVETGELLWQSQAQVSAPLAAIITKMVRYHFKDRYQSATDALAEVEQLAPLYLPTEISAIAAPTQLLSPQNPSCTEIITPTVSVCTKPNFNAPALLTNNLQVPETTIISPPKQRLAANRRPYYLAIGATIGAVLVAVGASYALYWQPRLKLEQTLEQLENLKATGKYSECINNTSKINPNSSLYADAQNVLHECKLIEAKRLAANTDFKAAITLVSSLPLDSNAYGQAKPLINRWSNSILALATGKYQAGKLKEAIALARNIPSHSSGYQKAQATIKQWQVSTAKTNAYTSATVEPAPRAKPTNVAAKKIVRRTYKPAIATAKSRSYAPKKVVRRNSSITVTKSRSYAPKKVVRRNSAPTVTKARSYAPKKVVRRNSSATAPKPRVYTRASTKRIIQPRRVVATARNRPSSSRKYLRISKKVTTRSQVRTRMQRGVKRINISSKRSDRRQRSYRWTTKTVR